MTDNLFRIAARRVYPCKEKMAEEKRYELKTIEDILNIITAENIENFLEGFKSFLGNYCLTTTSARLGAAIQGLDWTDKKNTEIVKCDKMIYIDDGKQENHLTITIK